MVVKGLEEELELFKRSDGKYAWNPISGKDYFMGYHHGRVAGIHLVDVRKVTATYVGERRGWRVFYEVNKLGEVFEFKSNPLDSAIWFGGEDEPSTPSFQVAHLREITENAEKIKALAEINKCKATRPIKRWNY